MKNIILSKSIKPVALLIALTMITMAVFVFFSNNKNILHAETEEKIDIPEGAIIKKERIEDFMTQEKEVIFEREIFDFSNNKFLLYELSPKGYAIYSVKGEARVFLEGFYEENSPFNNVSDKEGRYIDAKLCIGLYNPMYENVKIFFLG